MKKVILFIIIVMINGLFLIGCQSVAPDRNLGVYDSSISADQLCTLEVAGGLKIVGFNEQEVSWGEYIYLPSFPETNRYKNTHKNKASIQIPSGNHTLQVDLYLYRSDEYVRDYMEVKGLKIQYNFLPGHTYFLRPVFKLKSNAGIVMEYENATVTKIILPSGKFGYGPWNLVRMTESLHLILVENEITVAQSESISRN